MSDDRIKRRYCAIIQLSKASSMARIAESVPLILDMIERWSNKDYEQLCRSNDAQLFGYVFKTKKPAGMLSAEFESCPGTQQRDTFIVFELGRECSSSTGFQRPLAWVQHH